MLPQGQKRTTTITLALLFFIVFSFCSWTLASSIVSNQAVPKKVIPDSDPDPDPAPTSTQTTHEETLPPKLNQSTSQSDTPFNLNPTNKEPSGEKQTPASPTVATPSDEAVNIHTSELQQPVFPTEPYSLEVLRGKSGPDKRVALTFDDGPNADWTTKYLSILKEKSVPATFFFIGQLLEKNTDIVHAVIEDGHEVGIHSHTHRKLTGLGESQIKQDLIDSALTLHNITQQTVAYFRPPYGATNSKVIGVAHELGQTVVTWNVDPRDWGANDSKQIVDQVLSQVQAGSIILLHEGKPQTFQALPIIIDRLHQEGYEFVTVSELFEFASPTIPPEASITESGIEPTNIP